MADQTHKRVVAASSILAADFSRPREQLDSVTWAGGDSLRFDIDDGITATQIIAAGVGTLISGTSVFGVSDRVGWIAAFRGTPPRNDNG